MWLSLTNVYFVNTNKLSISSKIIMVANLNNLFGMEKHNVNVFIENITLLTNLLGNSTKIGEIIYHLTVVNMYPDCQLATGILPRA